MIEALLGRIAVAPNVAAAARRAAARAAEGAERRDAVAASVHAKVLAAFVAEDVTESDLASTLGYGYDDAARARYESLLARLFGAERALARLSFVSGTHAIVTALDACLPHGGRLVAATGRPYDTLRNAIAEAPQCLVERGVEYAEIPLAAGGGPDLTALERCCAAGVDVVFVQRSRGYAVRHSLSAATCGEIVAAVARAAPRAVVLVDDCYGELVEATEPTEHGAHLVMGSLIKNLGGGLAPGGGYVAGRADLVERVATRHFAPGLGTALGSTLGFGRALVQGLFLAPLVVAEALAGLDFAASLFEDLGFAVHPAPNLTRYDIVQAIELGDPEMIGAFARGLQRAMPINARFMPEPAAVPGYRDPVVMSGGAFVPGATIELSCDAPLRPPFEVYLQGGTTRHHAALGALFAADAVCGNVSRRDRRIVQHPTKKGAHVTDPGKSLTRGGANVERRRFVRVAVAADIAYTREDAAVPMAGILSDLGGGGIRVATVEDLPLGSVLLVRFRTPSLEREIVARGRIVLSFFEAKQSRYLHGIAFTQIDPRDQEAIVAFVTAEIKRLETAHS